MKHHLSLSCWALAAALTLAACAPTTFSLKDTTALALGRLRDDEYRSLFGAPRSVRTVQESDGPRKIVWFENEHDRSGQACARTLRLEFKEGTLNAFLGSSSCQDDVTSVERRALDDLKPAIGKMTREELANSLPQPAGKAHCPSALSEFKTRCDQGAIEVWAWLSSNDPLGQTRGSATTLGLVSFDAYGKLQDARIEEYGALGPVN